MRRPQALCSDAFTVLQQTIAKSANRDAAIALFAVVPGLVVGTLVLVSQVQSQGSYGWHRVVPLVYFLLFSIASLVTTVTMRNGDRFASRPLIWRGLEAGVAWTVLTAALLSAYASFSYITANPYRPPRDPAGTFFGEACGYFGILLVQSLFVLPLTWLGGTAYVALERRLANKELQNHA